MSLIVLYLGTRYDVNRFITLQDITICLFYVTFDLHLWPSAFVKVTCILIIICILCCWMFVPKKKFVVSHTQINCSENITPPRWRCSNNNNKEKEKNKERRFPTIAPWNFQLTWLTLKRISTDISGSYGNFFSSRQCTILIHCHKNKESPPPPPSLAIDWLMMMMMMMMTMIDDDD